MPKVRFAALAAAMILLSAPPISRAAAMAAARAPAVSASFVREASIVCSGNGCNVVQTKGLKRRKFKPLGYTKPI